MSTADVRLPAFASWSSDARRGIGPSLRSAYRARLPPGPRRGYRVPHERAATGVGAPCTPRTAVLLPADKGSSAGACRFSAASPCTPLPAFHPARFELDEASTGVQAIHPSGLPLTCGPPDGTGAPWAFPRASHPTGSPPATHVGAGTGRRALAWDYALNISRTSSPRVPSSRATSCRRPL